MKSNKFCHIFAGIVTVLGLLTVIGGVLLIVLGDDWIAAAVKKGCRLEPGTTVYKLWRDSPVPMYAHIYVFDLVNGSAFLDGSKPIVRQRGPFVYKEERQKVDVERNPNRTISYNETRTYTFQPDLSSESESVNITTINIVYMTLINYLREKDVPNVIRKIIGDVLPVAKEQVLMNLSVKDFLWGYKDPILAKLVSFGSGFFTMDMVSIYNASVSGAGLNRFLINDGVDYGNETNRIERVGQIEGFNFAERLNNWSDDYANQINGTDSTLWHPTVSQEERVYTFISDICRSVYLNFNETRENEFDIDTYRFVLPDRVFSNATENRGFCLFDSALNQTKCLPSGLFSLSSCVKMSGSSLPIQLPIIASSPHFLGADPLVRDAVVGLNPNDTAHRSYMDIEPITGIVMNGSRRLQINFNIINDSQIIAIKNLIPMAYPMIWLDEHAEIDKTHADDFRHEVYLPMNLVNYAKYILPSVGAFLMILVGSVYLYRWYRTRNRDSAFPSSDPDERTPLRS